MSLSVIVYGRNDAHGYNLHKRAAISLNCIAELLSGPDDELLFVDYNTPDELPTFPEAIQDTLTARARRLLKILRVRPHLHTRFAAHTHLPALEPVARNVALRRSNPDNRWVLSTNTDMIFAPHTWGRTLTEIVGELSDGFYHLPRYELPESLWEVFDRRDPQQIIADTRDWARQFHLKEIVYGSETAIYDAPGDFQLGLRRDYWAIDGFDERMLLGWHVDANLAKRMSLLRGRVQELEADLAGYHCDHTRLATLVHRVDRQENDSARFVDGVEAPSLPDQTDQWGLAGEDIETFQLSASASRRYLNALSNSMKEPQARLARGYYTSDAYNRPEYEWRHALPFLLDSVSTCPPGEVIGYAGATPELFDAFAAALQIMSPSVRLLRPHQLGWLSPVENGEVADWDQWSSTPGAFIFEIGWSADGDVRLGERRSADVLALFDRFVLDRRPGAQRARIIGVNAVNTALEVMINRVAVCAPTPFGSRVRHGYMTERVVEDSPAAPPSFDWSDPIMMHFASRFMGSQRTPWAWERTVMLSEMHRACGRRGQGERPKILLVAHLAEPLGLMLVDCGMEVDFVDPLAMLGEEGSDWRGQLHEFHSLVRDPLAAMGEGSVYDAILCPQNAMLIRGFAGAGRLLERLDGALVASGLLLFSLNAAEESSFEPPTMCARELTAQGFGRRFARASGYLLSSSAARADEAGGVPSGSVNSVWTWRKGIRTVGAGALSAAFLPEGRPLDLTSSMRAKDWISGRPGDWRVSEGAPEGHVLFGPYLPLAGGRYRAVVELTPRSASIDEPVVRLEVAFGEEVVAMADYATGSLSGREASIEFTAPPEGVTAFELRLVHFARADLRIGRIRLVAGAQGQTNEVESV